MYQYLFLTGCTFILFLIGASNLILIAYTDDWEVLTIPAFVDKMYLVGVLQNHPIRQWVDLVPGCWTYSTMLCIQLHSVQYILKCTWWFSSALWCCREPKPRRMMRVRAGERSAVSGNQGKFNSKRVLKNVSPECLEVCNILSFLQSPLQKQHPQQRQLPAHLTTFRGTPNIYYSSV